MSWRVFKKDKSRKKWTVEGRDQDGVKRRMPAFRDRALSDELARNVARVVEHRRQKAPLPPLLAGWVQDPEARIRYVEAFERSDFEAMLNYYKANYPRQPYAEDTSPLVKVNCPVLVIHGLDDPYLLAGALDRTWEWIDADLTLVTIPGANHFVQQDATDLVNRSMLSWLNR